MTTAYRDTATRCARCQRVTYGCGDFWVRWREELDVIDAHAWLCPRCRGEVRDAALRLMGGAQVREVVA